jgi:hypothetical protein
MNEPRYVALVGAEFVASADTLDALLSLVRDLHSPDAGENVACWDGCKLLCVMRPDGSLLSLVRDLPYTETDLVAQKGNRT